MPARETFYEVMRRHGITRRSFLKFCSLTAAGLGLAPEFAGRIAHALETKPRTPVVWLHGLECTCCTESFIRSGNPLAGDVVLSMISLDYDDTLMAAAGHAAEAALQEYAERLRVLHQIDQAILAAQSSEAITEAASSETARFRRHQRQIVLQPGELFINDPALVLALLSIMRQLAVALLAGRVVRRSLGRRRELERAVELAPGEPGNLLFLADHAAPGIAELFWVGTPTTNPSEAVVVNDLENQQGDVVTNTGTLNFLEDIDGNGNIDHWVRAGEWENEQSVLGVRAGLLFVSPDAVTEAGTTSFQILDETETSRADGKLRMNMDSVFAIRGKGR